MDKVSHTKVGEGKGFLYILGLLFTSSSVFVSHFRSFCSCYDRPLDGLRRYLYDMVRWGGGQKHVYSTAQHSTASWHRLQTATREERQRREEMAYHHT